MKITTAQQPGVPMDVTTDAHGDAAAAGRGAESSRPATSFLRQTGHSGARTEARALITPSASTIEEGSDVSHGTHGVLVLFARTVARLGFTL
jgi:hypothetical protein